MKRDEIKSIIERRFEDNVKGRIPDLTGFNRGHDGAEGDWLTKQMGLTVNGKNEPDFMGFEMKKDSPKTTFGDWSPDLSPYKRISGQKAELPRDEFLRIFGSPKSDPDPRKNGRYSWSGEVFPKVGRVNKFGQTLVVNELGDIQALYSFDLDEREDKELIVPEFCKKKDFQIALWKHETMKERVERKFNQLGWFKLVKDKEGRYVEIHYGLPINFESFIEMVRAGDVFCDCGMHQGNARPYMTWRASHQIWDSLRER